MSEAERLELEDALMAADLKLRQKQIIWETPRNIALIVAAVAGIAGVLGFKLGQREPHQPTQFVLPPGTTIQVSPTTPAPK